MITARNVHFGHLVFSCAPLTLDAIFVLAYLAQNFTTLIWQLNFELKTAWVFSLLIIALSLGHDDYISELSLRS